MSTRNTILLLANALALAQTANTQTAIVPANYSSDSDLTAAMETGVKNLTGIPSTSTGRFHTRTNIELNNWAYVVNTAAGSTVVPASNNDSVLESSIISAAKSLSGAPAAAVAAVTGLES